MHHILNGMHICDAMHDLCMTQETKVPWLLLAFQIVDARGKQGSIAAAALEALHSPSLLKR